MKEWATPENICKVLRTAQDNGINTHQFSYHAQAMADFRKFRDEGGQLQWILLGGGAMKDDLALIPQVAKLGPIGIVHHGGVTDQRFRDGQHAKVEEFLKRVRDSGVMVGLSSHRPQNIEYAEERGWDIDFYMACFHQLSRPKEELKRMLGELPIGHAVFLEEDPARMCRVIRQTPKPCLAFKILGAGRSAETREELEQSFRFAFENIKPYDAVIVGMYPRFKDEVKENAELVRRLAMPT
jgi:histidinol phosphatase-like PHP family hydrolase